MDANAPRNGGNAEKARARADVMAMNGALGFGSKYVVAGKRPTEARTNEKVE